MLCTLALAVLLVLSLARAIAAPALQGRAGLGRPVVSHLKAAPGVDSLTVSWHARRGAPVHRWRLSWRSINPRGRWWSSPRLLAATARSFRITRLRPGLYEVHIWPVLAHGRLGRPFSVRARALRRGPSRSNPSTKNESPSSPQPAGVCTPATGRTFYVSPGGSDKNPGTSPALAWRTLAKVNAAGLRGGDTVLFQGGAVFSETNLVGNAGGESCAPITYASYGSGKADIQDGQWDASHSHLVYDNLLVSGPGTGGSANGFGGRGSDVTVENSTITNVSAGIETVTGNDWHILDDTIENTGNSGILTQVGDNGGDPGYDWVIDGNTINDTGLVDLGYAEHGIYLKCRDSEVAHNTITNFSITGISQRYGGATIVANKISGGEQGIVFIPYDNVPNTSLWAENEVTDVQLGLYSPLNDAGSPSPGGTTHESFIISKNIIGPLTGGSTEFIEMHTTGTVSESANIIR